VLIGGVLAAVVVVGVIAAVIVSRRAQDDEHSVEHYHQRLHTLEELRTHTAAEAEGREDNGQSEAAYPASAFRVSGSTTVRLTDDPGHSIVPPVPPPPVPNPSEPVLFEDDKASDARTFMTGVDDPVMHSINRRPRRLGGPLAAVAAVAVLIAVLIVTGLHSNPPKKKSGTATTVTTSAPAHHSHAQTGAGSTTHGKKTTTTTTAAPTVSSPTLTSANGATYQVSDASYSLALSAKTGECWISATDTTTGTTLFSGVLSSGQSHTLAANGPVTVIAGAPAAFAATVNGAAVALPFGYQAPFTLKFLTPGAGGTSTANAATGSTTTTTSSGSTSNSGGF
jgi:hypothetical protein